MKNLLGRISAGLLCAAMILSFSACRSISAEPGTPVPAHTAETAGTGKRYISQARCSARRKKILMKKSQLYWKTADMKSFCPSVTVSKRHSWRANRKKNSSG